MKLSNIITDIQTVSLISESDTHAALSLMDQRTGEVKRLDISADMAVMPDEALISLKVTDDRDYVNLREWWARGDSVGHEKMGEPVIEIAPPATWTITPDGQEIDLRMREGGLF